MTYHMEKTNRRSRRSLDFKAEDDIQRQSHEEVDENACPVGNASGTMVMEDALSPLSRPVQLWPQRLWDITNDPSNDMIQWVESGTGICIDDCRFETEVMELYPGFVQLPTFNNLRRQLRAYSFSWHQSHQDEGPQAQLSTRSLVFSHPFFIRGHAELLPYVVTKRKRGRSECEPPAELKRLSRHIQESGVSDVLCSDYQKPGPYIVSRPYLKRQKKSGTPGKLIEKAAALCDIPGGPLVSLAPNCSGYTDNVPPSHHGQWSDIPKGSFNIPMKYWNDSPEAEAIYPPPPPTHAPPAYGQYYTPHPYDPYGYYQYPEPWSNQEHGQYYTPHSLPIQGQQLQHPLDNNGHYYMDQQAPPYGYCAHPANVSVSDVASPVIPVVEEDPTTSIAETPSTETVPLVPKVEIAEVASLSENTVSDVASL